MNLPSPPGRSPPPPPPRDAHGFDPAAYHWIPVRRIARLDGWSAGKQRLFVGTLADTGLVTCAAREWGCRRRAPTRSAARPTAQASRAWDAGVRQAMDRLVDVRLDRALEGSEEPVFDRERRVIAPPHPSPRPHGDGPAARAPPRPVPQCPSRRPRRRRGAAAPLAPVVEAVEAIDPLVPAGTAGLMAPDDLAAIREGEVPHWHRDPGLVTAERKGCQAAAGTPLETLGPGFRKARAAAKAGTYRPSRKRRRKPLRALPSLPSPRL